MLSVSNTGPFPPCPAPFNMAAHVLQHATAQPNKVAVAVVGPDQTDTLAYDDLQRAVLGTAGGLLATGCTPGDLVLMRLGNTVDFPIAYLGALAAGLVPVPTSAALTSPEVAAIVADLSPRLVLRAPGIATAAGAPEMGLATLQALRAHKPADWHMGDPDRLGYVIYTSGTSGQPRAVAHAHRAIWARQMMHNGWYGIGRDDILLHAGAFNWTYTLGTGLMDPWTVGATAVIPASGTPPEQLPTLMADHGVTIFAAAPGVYRQMLDRTNPPPLPALRHGLSAGEKMSDTVHKRWHEATGTHVFEAYGMSECSTFISGSPEHPAETSHLGRAQPGRHIAILGPDGPVARGAQGTIAVHRSDPGLMLEYVNAPDDTAARFEGPWFLTGDTGIMEEDGQIRYLGRNDDMMNAGGYRVSPIEVETVLASYPGITGVGVTQIEVKTGVFVIAAFYTGPRALDEADLRTYVEAHLARYKQPRLFVHVPVLPAGANGKLIRRRLPLFWSPTRKE
ncbi:MAG: class I adenylate-forming enzyme family protein [Tateyamaria sp.]